MLSINLGGKLIGFDQPRIMGVINITPDSFYSESRKMVSSEVLQQVEQMISQGADIIDIGAFSSRPGAQEIPVDEELNRLRPVVRQLFDAFPEIALSIDTYRSEVVEELVNFGAFIVNDISAFALDAKLIASVARHRLPYILMHMKGKPDNMQDNPQYREVSFEVIDFMAKKLHILNEHGIADVIVDPGFGFGKSLEHNYQLLNALGAFRIFEKPVMVGVSRKSMVCKLLKLNPENALNGSTALHMVALLNGASVLRVHDVKEARECIQIFQALKSAVNN